MACAQPPGSQKDDPPASYYYEKALIGAGADPPMVDSVELGVGRNEDVLRLYTTRELSNSQGHQYSFSGAAWLSNSYFTASS